MYIEYSKAILAHLFKYIDILHVALCHTSFILHSYEYYSDTVIIIEYNIYTPV